MQNVPFVLLSLQSLKSTQKSPSQGECLRRASEIAMKSHTSVRRRPTFPGVKHRHIVTYRAWHSVRLLGTILWSLFCEATGNTTQKERGASQFSGQVDHAGE